MNERRHMTDVDWDAVKKKHASMTKEEARAWIKLIVGPARRVLDEQERNELLTVIRLSGIQPSSSSNNQRTITDVFYVNNARYHFTYGLEDDVIIEEILKD